MIRYIQVENRARAEIAAAIESLCRSEVTMEAVENRILPQLESREQKTRELRRAPADGRPPEKQQSSWQEGSLLGMFRDGWNETAITDDFASVWKFEDPVRYLQIDAGFSTTIFDDIAQTSWPSEHDDSPDPGWQSFDFELDAVGGVPLASAVPEPSTFTLAGSSVLGMFAVGWRRLGRMSFRVARS